MRFLNLDAPPGDNALQLVVSLGPASLGLARELAQAGATSFRLNASHLSPAALAGAVAQVRWELPGAPVVVDLQGAKMRLGCFHERTIRQGDAVRFGCEADRGDALPLPHPELFRAVEVGDTLSCDDDRLRFCVTHLEEFRIEARALTGGTLRPRKGVNRVEHPLELEDLGEGDAAAMTALSEEPDLAFTFSFMQDGAEAEWVRRRRPGAVVVGKVERAEAVRSLSLIASRVDALWICRGDLGAQLGLCELGRTVSSLAPTAWPCPVLMAGQVLEHLTEHTEPTRSEVCHLADLVARGYAGVVLSDETAIGRDPVGAVRVASGLLLGLSELLG